ncbi:DNA cytosine methyltransferase [Peptoniphilus genitalis]
MKIKTVGSLCSGIEAASVAWMPLGLDFKWFSEIADFPSKVLKARYPNIPNLGDMNDVPALLKEGKIDSPDLICAGTPCQAFSFAGYKNGLEDDRGNLTLKFIDVIEENDKVRKENNLPKTIAFWENVEGVLSDKTNAFGCLVSYLSGLDTPIELKKWPSSGVIHGKERNVAWRVLDSKFFGLPQQRKRLYLLATDTSLNPENILFEKNQGPLSNYPESSLIFTKNDIQYEIFREYTDCLYASYGTKWNGNAAAMNGSLFVSQDGNVRRLSPLETERLMGFPDDYTNIEGAKKTPRYQANGNSWSVPVIKWIGERLLNYNKLDLQLNLSYLSDFGVAKRIDENTFYLPLGNDLVRIDESLTINATNIPEEVKFGNMSDIVSDDAPEDIYLSPAGGYGIVRRKNERNMKMNSRLEDLLIENAKKMSKEEIEKRSRVQKRGKYSQQNKSSVEQINMFD